MLITATGYGNTLIVTVYTTPAAPTTNFVSTPTAPVFPTTQTTTTLTNNTAVVSENHSNPSSTTQDSSKVTSGSAFGTFIKSVQTHVCQYIYSL